MNGNAPNKRRDHGTERRGLHASPDLSYVGARQKQSLADKTRYAKMSARLKEALKNKPVELDLGNKELPAYKHKQDILAMVEAYDASILGGEPGSGKSTQLPQFLKEAGYDMTVMLVPRKIIADGLGDRLREELSSQIKDYNAEEDIGIIHSGRSERHRNNSIIVATPNSFINMMNDFEAEMSDKKVAIVPDEIHEANVFTEVALGVAAKAVQRHEKWRLVPSSATHNEAPLKAALQDLNKERSDGFVPTLNISGRPFKMEKQEVPDKTVMQAYADMYKSHEKSLLFTSGVNELDHIIKKAQDELEEREPGSAEKVVFRKYHSDLSTFETSRLNEPVPDGYRLAIVSTPAAMSGVTFPGVTLVIADGTINRPELDEDGVSGLVRRQLSKAELTQQFGRAGRDVAGGIGVLARPVNVLADDKKEKEHEESVSELFVPFDERKEHGPAEIYNMNLSRVVLSVAGVGNKFMEINEHLPHRVEDSSIIAAQQALQRLGALDDDNNITDIGISMNRFPLAPELARGLHEVDPKVNQRTTRHIARAAFIAAAIDVGGLQSFREKERTEWRELIRPTTDDDFIAQLDIMNALYEHQQKSEEPLHAFIDRYSLSPKRVERALKVSRKILLRQFDIHPDNIPYNAPIPEEEKMLRDDFTAGMFDFVFKESGKIHKDVQYRNILGSQSSKNRLLSNRSVANPEKNQYVAGFQRWFLKKGVGEKVDIIELVLLVDPEVVAKHALANNLLQSKPLDPRMDGDRVVDRKQMMFGSIEVGKPVISEGEESISAISQELIIERALNRPGEAQRALRKVAVELEEYRERIPAEALESYRRPDAPVDLTKEFIEELVREYAQHTRFLHEIDTRLAQYLYSKNMTINSYFEDEAREALQKMSPEWMEIGGSETYLQYRDGKPYITRLSSAQRKHLGGPVYLDDGREVMLQVAVQGGGTRWISIGEVAGSRRSEIN